MLTYNLNIQWRELTVCCAVLFKLWQILAPFVLFIRKHFLNMHFGSAYSTTFSFKMLICKLNCFEQALALNLKPSIISRSLFVKNARTRSHEGRHLLRGVKSGIELKHVQKTNFIT